MLNVKKYGHSVLLAVALTPIFFSENIQCMEKELSTIEPSFPPITRHKEIFSFKVKENPFVSSDKEDLLSPSAGLLFPASGSLFSSSILGENRYVLMRSPWQFLKNLKENQILSLQISGNNLAALGENMDFPWIMRTPPPSLSSLSDYFYQNLAFFQGWEEGYKTVSLKKEFFPYFPDFPDQVTRLTLLKINKLHCHESFKKILEALPKFPCLLHFYLEDSLLKKETPCPNSLRQKSSRQKNRSAPQDTLRKKTLESLFGKALSSCKDLKYISLIHVGYASNFFKKVFKNLNPNNRFIYLNLSRNKSGISASFLRLLSKNLINLETLFLEDCNLSSSFIKENHLLFSEFRFLVTLRLAGNCFSERELISIVGQESVRSPTIFCAPVEDEEILKFLKESYDYTNPPHSSDFYEKIMEMAKKNLTDKDYLTGLVYYNGKKGEKLRFPLNEVSFVKDSLRNQGVEGLIFANDFLDLEPFYQPFTSPTQEEFFKFGTILYFLGATRRDVALQERAQELIKYLVNYAINFVKKSDTFSSRINNSLHVIYPNINDETPELRSRLVEEEKEKILKNYESYLPKTLSFSLTSPENLEKSS